MTSGKRIPPYVRRLPVAPGHAVFFCRTKLSITSFTAEHSDGSMLRRLAALQDAADALGFAVFIAGFTLPESDPFVVKRVAEIAKRGAR